MGEIKTTAFLSVFDAKLSKLYKQLKAEYDKPKSERNKQSMKALVVEAKKLKKLVDQMKQQDQFECQCPACGHKFPTPI